MQYNPYDEIRARVSCLEAGRYYGADVKRSGFICCPFHNERTPSLKLYDGDRGFYCYGCGKGGDVIELASGLLNLSRVQAAEQLNRDFSLGLSFGKDRETAEQRRQREEQQAMRERYRQYCAWLDMARYKLTRLHYLGWQSKDIAPEALSEESAQAVRDLPTCEYYLDTLEDGKIGEIEIIRPGIERMIALYDLIVRQWSILDML